MRMTKHLLTDFSVNQIQCPAGKKHIEIFDNQIKGFYVDVQSSGHKSFRLRYRLNAVAKVITLGNAKLISAEEAKQLAIGILRKVQLGIAPKPIISSPLQAGPCVQEFFLEKYLPYVKSYKRSWDTDESMIRNHLVSKIGHLHMGSMKAADVAQFVERMKSENYAPGTCNRALVLLRYGFELAIRWHTEGVKSNPAKEIKNIQNDNKIERFLSPTQTMTLLQAVRQSDSEMLQYIVLFLIYSGARKREVLDAKWQDIDWDQKSWRIPKTKSGKVRHVPLSTGSLSLLLNLKRRLNNITPGTQFIFANPKTNKAFVSFYYSWNNARIRAGMPQFRIHDLRHSFASSLVNAGRSLYEVQELLGHADIKTTSRYAHLSRERLLAAVEVIPQFPIQTHPEEPKQASPEQV